MHSSVEWGLLATAFGLGLRHGVDWDHLAAITDLTGGSDDRRRSMRLASLYAGGHALVVLALGSVAVVAGDYVPDSLDRVMGRVVGVTLLLLGGYVLYGLVRHGREFRMRSRWVLVGSLVRRVLHLRRDVVRIVHEHEHDHDGQSHGHRHPPSATADGSHSDVIVTTQHRHVHVHEGFMPDDPDAVASPRTAFVVGLLHGIGAETPTQVVLFVTAAGAIGAASGVAVLVVFTLGLLTSNSAIALASTAGFLHARRNFRVYAAVAAFTGIASFSLGMFYLFELGELPAIL